MQAFKWFEEIVGFSERKWNYTLETETLPNIYRKIQQIKVLDLNSIK